MFMIILLAPILQLILLGYAVNMDVEDVTTVVIDRDRSPESREFLNTLESSGYFKFVERTDSYETLQEKIEEGEALLGIVIPTDFEKQIGRNKTANVQAIFDGSDGNKGAISAGYLQGALQKYANKLTLRISNITGHVNRSVPIVEAETRAWYNPELKTRVFMVPGIVGLLVSIITLILTSLAIVKEKEIGTLEQIIVTPIKPLELIIGKLIPFAILGFVSIILVLAAMYLFFGIAIRGNILFLFLGSFLYILSTLGLGLFVSTISKTQQQAMMLAVFVVLLPMVFLSGFAFPIENMPDAIQYTTYIVPLRYFMTIIRGAILKGTGFAELWAEVLMLFLMGATVLALSALRFNKRLD